MSAPFALQWPRRGLRERTVGAGTAPDLCGASPPLSPPMPTLPPRGGAGRTLPKSMRCRAPPAASTSRGCPSWCREQHCRNPRGPWHDLHAGALCESHKGCMWRCCPTLLDPARCAGGGKGGWGSWLMGDCGASPSVAGAPVLVLRAPQHCVML